jgi:hypothetical protein
MAKIRVKGSVIKQDIASTLTAVAQVIEFGASGASAENYESTTLDTIGAGKEYDATGYSEGGTFDFSLFFDPALAGHQALTDDITTPPTTNRDYSITFADADTTEWTFTSAGLGLDITGAMNDGLKADVSIKLTGLMTYAT